MIELISLICSLAICVATPIEMAKVRNGWVSKKFEGNRAGFLAAYAKQLNMLVWIGVGLGTVTAAMIAIESNPGERIFKAVAAAVWFAVAAISFVSRRSLPAY